MYTTEQLKAKLANEVVESGASICMSSSQKILDWVLENGDWVIVEHARGFTVKWILRRPR